MNDIAIENVQALHDLLTAQIKLLWNKTARRYKIQRNVKIKVVAMPYAAMYKGFRCGDCGPAVLKAPPIGQIVAILRLPSERFATGLDTLMDDTIPHGLAHIACQLRPDIGHGYCHDAGLNEVYNWIKENA